MKNNNVLIIGSVAMDSIETPFGKKETLLGGSATYSSASASFFNRNVGIVAVVGEDFPRDYYNVLKKKGINLDGLESVPGKTFRWSGNYKKDLNSPETVYTHLNVFSDFKPVIPEDQKASPFIFLANIDPDLQESVLRQAKNPEVILCDTMNYWIEKKPNSLKKLIKKSDFFLLNESEARQLSGETNLLKAAKGIMSFGAKSLIIKKGEHGLLFFSDNFNFAAPAFLLDSILDPTGAGDTFAGGMIGYLSHQRKFNEDTIRKSLVYGNIMASFVVEEFSVNRIIKLTETDFEKRYKKFKAITRF